MLTVNPSQITITSCNRSRRDNKVDNKEDLIKTLLSDLYAKQSEILNLKQEMDAEVIFQESVGSAQSAAGDIRRFEKVRIS
jgi:hypothetical protein